LLGEESRRQSLKDLLESCAKRRYPLCRDHRQHIDVRRQMLEDEAGESRPFACIRRAQLGHQTLRELPGNRAQQSALLSSAMDRPS